MIHSVALFLLLAKILLLFFGIKNNRNNLFFIFFLLTINVYYLAHIYWVIFKDITISLILVNHFTPLYFITGPLLFFYVKSILSGGYVFRERDLLHGIPSAVQFIAISGYILLPNTQKEIILNTLLENPQNAINLKFNFLFSNAGNFSLRFVSLLIYITLSFRLIIEKKEVLKHYYKTKFWLLSILISFSVLIVSYALIISKVFLNPESLFVILGSKVSIIALLSLTLIALLPLFFPHILYGSVKLKSQKAKSVKTHPLESLPNRKMISLSKRIVSYFEDKEPYLEKQFTLQQLAKEMKVPMHHIQKCFKEVHKTTFVDFKTRYKIKWAVNALYDPLFKNDTIDSIGLCAGFNSKSQFYAAFKKCQKMTPKQYLKKYKKPRD